MVLLADVLVGQIQVRLFCDLYTGMPENFTEGKNIHAVHQASFGEVISQAMGRVLFIQSGTQYVFLEIAFKVTHADGAAVFFDREEVVTLHISVLKLQPPPNDCFCLRGEVYRSVFPAFGFFRSEIDPLPGKFQIRHQYCGAFTEPHSAVQHQHYHDIIPVFGEIGLVELGQKFLQIFVREEDFCLPVILQLPDTFHGILADDVFPFHPVKEHSDITDVVVDGGDAYGLAVIPSAVGTVLALGKIVDIEGVFSTHHQIINVLADHILCDFIHSVNLQFIGQPTTEKMEGLLIAAHGFFTQLCTTAIKHKFIGKPLKIQIFHAKNTPVHWGDFDPIKQEYSLVQRKKFIGMKTRFYTYQSHLHCIGQPKEKSRKPVAPQSEIGNLGRLQLKLQFVCDKGDEFGIGGLSLGIADGVAKEALEGIQVAPIPGHLDGVANGPFHSGRGGVECLRHLGVQYLGDGVGVLTARLGALPDALFETYK